MRNDNPRTGFCKEPGRGRSDSSAAARNECDFSVEIAHLVTFEFDAGFGNLVNLRRVASGTPRVVIRTLQRDVSVFLPRVFVTLVAKHFERVDEARSRRTGIDDVVDVE